MHIAYMSYRARRSAQCVFLVLLSNTTKFHFAKFFLHRLFLCLVYHYHFLCNTTVFPQQKLKTTHDVVFINNAHVKFPQWPMGSCEISSQICIGAHALLLPLGYQ